MPWKWPIYHSWQTAYFKKQTVFPISWTMENYLSLALPCIVTDMLSSISLFSWINKYFLFHLIMYKSIYMNICIWISVLNFITSHILRISYCTVCFKFTLTIKLVHILCTFFRSYKVLDLTFKQQWLLYISPPAFALKNSAGICHISVHAVHWK
jgi:hypothetical protein